MVGIEQFAGVNSKKAALLALTNDRLPVVSRLPKNGFFAKHIASPNNIPNDPISLKRHLQSPEEDKE